MTAHDTGKIVSSIDVARLAGVSQSTVSRAFTQGASVSEKTRQKIIDAAEELGYQPNRLAGSLINKSTKIIGIVMVKFRHPLYSKVLEKFTLGLRRAGYQTLLLNLAHEAEVEEYLPTALQYQVDGLIMTASSPTSKIVRACERSDTPVILFNRYDIETRVNAVFCDNVSAGEQVADLLMETGHTRCAYVADTEALPSSDRERGFVKRLEALGSRLAFRDCGDFSYESGGNVARRLMAKPTPPDAMFFANDYMALGALDVVRSELGISVPDDLAIVGFDDLGISGWPCFSLTTVTQPIDEMVAATVDTLLSALSSKSRERVMKSYPAILKLRSTTRR
jgi:DNA-binding LacI/PurR family transcriptional regulator